MIVFLYLEITLIGFVLIGVMYFNFGEKRNFHGTLDQKLFDLLLYFNSILLITDCASWLLVENEVKNTYFWFFTINTIYYFAQPCICFIWLLYADYKVNNDKIGLAKRIKFYIIPLVISDLLVVCNCFTDILFSLENNTYSRGNHYYIYMLICLVYFLIADRQIIIKTKNMNEFDKREVRKHLLFYPIPPLLGIIIQTFIYGIPIIWICSALGLLVIYINFQNIQNYTDFVTGLYNRRPFEKNIEARIKNASNDRKMFLIVIDVDDFKKTNDTYGHAIGDDALRSIAEILKRSTEVKDFLARIGGDEFAITGERNSIEEVKDLIANIEQRETEFNNINSTYIISLSKGYAIYGENGILNSEDMIKYADKDMYLIKNNRKIIKKS